MCGTTEFSCGITLACGRLVNLPDYNLLSHLWRRFKLCKKARNAQNVEAKWKRASVSGQSWGTRSEEPISWRKAISLGTKLFHSTAKTVGTLSFLAKNSWQVHDNKRWRIHEAFCYCKATQLNSIPWGLSIKATDVFVIVGVGTYQHGRERIF